MLKLVYDKKYWFKVGSLLEPLLVHYKKQLKLKFSHISYILAFVIAECVGFKKNLDVIICVSFTLMTL